MRASVIIHGQLTHGGDSARAQTEAHWVVGGEATFMCGAKLRLILCNLATSVMS